VLLFPAGWYFMTMCVSLHLSVLRTRCNVSLHTNRINDGCDKSILPSQLHISFQPSLVLSCYAFYSSTVLNVSNKSLHGRCSNGWSQIVPLYGSHFVCLSIDISFPRLGILSLIFLELHDMKPFTSNWFPLNAELNPIFHLLTSLGAHHITHVSKIRVNWSR
jgi:hypothetical protein